MKIPMLIALLALAVPAFAAPPDQITDDDTLLFVLQEAVFLEDKAVDTGRQFLKRAGGLSDGTSYTLIEQAIKIVRETENDIAQASRSRTCAKRASLTTAEKLGKELNAEEQRSADERRQKASSIRSTVSAEELERILQYADRYSNTTILVLDHEKELRGRNAAQIITRLCGSA